MRSLSSAFLLLIFIGIGVLPLSTKGQDTVNGYYIDISKINLSKYLKNEISSAFINKNESPGDKLSSLYFTPGVIWDAPISNNYVTKRLLLKFHLTNSSDTTASTWFFPGLFFKEIILYSIQGNDLTELPSISPEDKTISSYKEISLPAHESLTVLVELLPLKTYINSVRPRLIAPRFLSSYVAVQYNATADENMITYIFCGLLLLMIIYSMANFFLGSNPEFLYYSGYAFFLGLMLFLKTYLEVQTTSFSLFMESYLDFIMQGTGIIFYMVFMQKFLETKTKYRFLYHFYSGGIIMLAVSLALYSYSYFYTDNYPFQYNIETLTKLLLLLMVIVFLVYSFRRRQDRLLNYLFWGNLCMFVFSLFSQFAIFLRSEFSNIPGMLGSSIFYYEIGITLELILFLLGLSYKNRRQLIEETKEKERLIAANKLISYEKELAVLKAQQEERDRISADMHDELGSGITVIRLMSEIAKSKMPGQIPVEIEKIS
ncbi:MAG: hypothetical protein JST10_05430, partial [Bacteroidetes bacterium]|nr:hypothetical protein [Bacteroidota bacterium]